MEYSPTSTSDAGSAGDSPSASRFLLELSPGIVEHIDGTVVIGRAPSARRVADLTLPRSITLATAHSDVARTHARFEVHGDEVLVTDLHSASGTLLFFPDCGPRQSRAGEPTPVTPDTVVSLGDFTTVVVRRVS